MEYRTLGRTGMQVSTLCLGTMMFGAWVNRDEQERRRMVDTALDAGVNLVDTAEEYADGESEETVGRALRGRRDDVILSTKFFHQMGSDRSRQGISRRWIMRAAEDSLRRLDTDWIDLYQAHRPDPGTDIEETLGALSDLIAQGKVRAIGTSTFPAEQAVEAQWVSRCRGRERCSAEQLSYSILARHAEASVLSAAGQYGLGMLAWSPLSGGWLAGWYQRGAGPAGDSSAARHPDHIDFSEEANRERKLSLGDQLTKLAAEAGLRLIQLALSFVTAHRAVTSAILGPRTHKQLLRQLTAADVRLDGKLPDAIDRLVPPGTDINPRDVGYVPLALTDHRLRRH